MWCSCKFKYVQKKIGTEFTVRGPKTSFVYNGFGKFSLQRGERTEEVSKRYLGLICEGTAISAFFQVVHIRVYGSWWKAYQPTAMILRLL